MTTLSDPFTPMLDCNHKLCIVPRESNIVKQIIFLRVEEEIRKFSINNETPTAA